MDVIARWALSEAALPRPGEVRTPEIRGVAPGDPTFAGEVEVVPRDVYEGAVSALREARACMEWCVNLGADDATAASLRRGIAVIDTATGGQ